MSRLPTHPHRSPALALALLSFPLSAAAQGPGPHFVTNAGQWPKELTARACVGGGSAWFYAEGVALQLRRLDEQQHERAGSIGGPALQYVDATIHLRFAGNARATAPTTEGERSMAPRWLRRSAGGAPAVLDSEAHSALRYRDVWPGVDVVFRGVDGRVAYEFDVAGKSSAAAIEFACDGLATPLEIADDGSLVMTSDIGTVRHTAPQGFELADDGTRVAVRTAFELRSDDRYGITVDRIDPDRALWIDPGIDWSTYFGGPDGATLRFNEHVAGDLFVMTGQSRNAVPAPWGTAAPTVRGVHTTLVDTAAGAAGALWTVMLTGSNDQLVLDMDYDDSTGLTTVVGITDSPDLPVTANAFQPTFGGVYDGFVMQLDLAGNLVYLSYYGGPLSDRICDVHARGGVVSVVGTTQSATLPMAGASLQPAIAGGHDAFVAQFDPTLSGTTQLLRSTFVGNATNQGGAYDPTSYIKNFDGKQIHVADSGEVTIAIQTATSSLLMPTTANAFQSASSGAADVWIGRFDPQLSTLLSATYLGGNGFDVPTCMAVDDVGLVTLGIVHQSSNLPVTTGAFDTSWSANSNDSFVCRVDLNQSGVAQIVYGSHFGGTDIDETNHVVLEPSSSIAIFVGQTRSAGFGIQPTAGSLQATPQATANATAGFVLRVAPEGNGLADVHYASYLLPGDATHPWGVALRDDGRAMITGLTWAPTIPSTATGPQSAYAAAVSGSPNGMAVLMDLLPTGVSPIGSASPGCAAGAYMQVNSQPAAGNVGFELYCEGAPASAFGVLGIGTPSPVGVPTLGATVHLVLPPADAITLFSDARGFARLALPIPAGIGAPFGVAAQFVWVQPSPCGGALLSGSNALTF